MKVWQALFTVLGIVLVLTWLEISVATIDDLDEFCESYALKIKTEYACEAATFAYSSNRAYWKDVYCVMMCNEYGMSYTDDNIARVLDSVAAAIYVSDTSIEILEKSTDRGEFLVSMGACIQELNDTEIILFDFFSERVSYLNKETVEKIDAADITELATVLSRGGVTLDVPSLMRYRDITRTKSINKALMRSYISLNENVDRVAYIPVKDIENMGINSIKSKTLIIIQKDFMDWNADTITTSGFAEADRTWIVGFIEDGIKYYCTEREAPDGIGNVEGNKLFKSVYDAAKEGYIPATHYWR